MEFNCAKIRKRERSVTICGTGALLIIIISTFFLFNFFYFFSSFLSVPLKSNNAVIAIMLYTEHTCACESSCRYMCVHTCTDKNSKQIFWSSSNISSFFVLQQSAINVPRDRCSDHNHNNKNNNNNVVCLRWLIQQSVYAAWSCASSSAVVVNISSRFTVLQPDIFFFSRTIYNNRPRPVNGYCCVNDNCFATCFTCFWCWIYLETRVLTVLYPLLIYVCRNLINS